MNPKFAFNTKWKNDELVCVCTQQGKCNKNHGCEELDFILDNSINVNDCMKHTSYTRHKGAIQQRR